MALEPYVVHRALYARLAADGTLTGHVGTRIYLGVAKQGVTFPYVRHQPLSMLPIEALGPDRCGMEAIWLVALVGRGEAIQALETAADRVDALLEGWQVTAESKALFWIAEEWRWEFPVVDGIQYREFQTTWRVQVQAA